MIDLATVKEHLRVDGGDEDALIQGYLDAALSTFETFSNRTLLAPEAALPVPPGNALVMSKSIRQGVLLLVGHWYANRETAAVGVTVADLPMGTQALWRPHRWSNF